MTRLRHRPDYFEWRGIRCHFHRHQDGPTLARLDPYAPGEQEWLLHSGRTIQVTAEEIRDITYEVHGLRLPDVNPDLKIIYDKDLEGRVATLEDQVAELLDRVAALEADAPVAAEPVAEPEPAPEPQLEPEPAPPAPDLSAELAALKEALAASEAARIKAEEALAEASKPPAPEPEHKFPASLDEKLSDYAVVEEALSTDDLLASARENPMAAEQTVQRLDRLKRKKFFELLNVELAELQQERGGPRENLKRESEIESLLGLFARVGEM